MYIHTHLFIVCLLVRDNSIIEPKHISGSMLAAIPSMNYNFLDVIADYPTDSIDVEIKTILRNKAWDQLLAVLKP